MAVESAKVPQGALTLGLGPLLLVGTAVGTLVQGVEAASAGVPPFAVLPATTEARPPHAGGMLFTRIWRTCGCGVLYRAASTVARVACDLGSGTLILRRMIKLITQ